MSLVTLAEFKAGIYHEANRSFTDDQITQALSIGEDSFYSQTDRHDLGYWIEARQLAVKLHSTGTTSLRCPYPVLALVSVTDDGTDILDSVTFNGHFIFYNDSKFGEVPNAIEETQFGTVLVTAKFGDPSDKIVRDDDLVPTIPWDVKDCIMRMAWHQLRREVVSSHQASSRDTKPSKETRTDMSRDSQIRQCINTWKVVEMSGMWDFR